MPITLRDRQLVTVKKVMNEFKEVNSTLIVWPTGTGKTRIFADIIRRFQPMRALVIAGRRELIWQARDRIMDSTGLEPAIEMGELQANDTLFSKAPVVICTVQTLVSENGDTRRMGKFNPLDFGLLVIDEAHNCISSTYKDVLNYFKKNPDLRILGVTATPDRADEQALGQIFETVADDYEILDAINDGWLVQVEQQIARVKGLDFSEMRTTAGDLNGADLAKEMERESNIQGVVQPILECMYRQEPHSLDSIPTPDWGKYIASLSVEPRRTLVFTVSVAQAEMLSNIFNRVREGMSNWVCGATKEDVRRERLDQFANGKCPVMVNCGVLIEGYDHPEIEIIGMARPTKSRSRYAQMVGRSLRPIPELVDALPSADERRAAIAASAKPCATILDFVGNAGRHKLVSSADILGGKVSDEAIERATRWIEKLGKAAPMAQALEQAEKDIKREADEARQAEEARKAKLVAKSRYVMRSVNPFDVLDLQPVKQRGWDDGKRLSDRQRAILLKQGIDPDQLPYAQGRQLLLEIFRRWDKKLCSFGQAKILRRRGLSTEVSREEASRLITEIAAKEHWRARAERQPA